jgi:hypothetical protein
MRILYSGAGGTVGINAVWDGGVQFDADGQSFSEGIVASFTAYDPDWSDQLQQGTTLRDQGTFQFALAGGVNTPNLLFRDPMGKWGTYNNTYTYNSYVITESLDTGTLYIGEQTGLSWVTPVSAGQFNIGGIHIWDMKWNFERTRLIIAGGTNGFLSPATIDGTLTNAQLFFYTPATNSFGTYGFVGTGTGFPGAGNSPTDAQIRSILPWSYGTYYLGGHMHRINSTLIGSRWNLFQWDGAGVPTAVAPVSATGTGFVWNQPVGLGSQPGIITNLIQFDQNRILMTVEGNRLRGFANGITTALYDVRGTWGTIPGFTQPLDAGLYDNGYTLDALKTPDQRVFLGYTGTSTFGSALVQIQGLTTNSIGTQRDGQVDYIVEDADTLAWVAGYFTEINGQNYNSALARTNGYDYLPSDFFSGGAQGLYVSTSGTLFLTSFNGGANLTVGTAAALGTIVNSGMSNVYPTLRIRNPSTGTAVIRQWANMTTKEYAWFALSMFPGETVELTTGPGRVAFQSTYRGDILSTIVAGSKLASWHLQPGQNIISFLADTDAVVADMYWTPRHHSADGTGIV